MSNDALKEFILTIVPEAECVEGTQFLLASIPAESLRQLALELKNSPTTAFDFLFCLTGVDYAEHLEVVYHLKSTSHNHQLVVKAKTNGRENPVVDTVCDLWRTAEFHEREIFDLFGIHFTNHPDLRRLLLTDDWVGYPLRKDYDDPINMIEY
jgi:NADH/F420H2 dehydrogenase subunit C